MANWTLTAAVNGSGVSSVASYLDPFTAASSAHTRYTTISSPSLEDILSAPGTAPTLPVERRVAEKLVRRLLAESEDNTITISTGGQVRHKITEQLLI